MRFILQALGLLSLKVLEYAIFFIMPVLHFDSTWTQQIRMLRMHYNTLTAKILWAKSIHILFL